MSANEKNSKYSGKEAEIKKLVEACAKGNKEKIKEFFDYYSQDIYNFPIKVFHLDRDSASDFFLYAFERLRSGRRFHSFQGKSRFKTWFYSVLRNLVIDWMRTVKTLPIVSINKIDSEGKEYQTIENEPDTKAERNPHEEEAIYQFNEVVAKIKVDQRIIFKLSYLYYLNLEPDEINYIAKKTGKEYKTTFRELMEIRDKLYSKQIKSIEIEDKITSLYQNILELKLKKKKILDSYSLSDEDKEMALSPFDSNVGILERIDKTLQKKYQQREKLLEKKDRGLLLVRTPYKYISELLNIPEGSLSVQLMRIMDKIKSLKKISDKQSQDEVNKP